MRENPDKMPETSFTPPTREQLENIAREFYRTRKRREFARLKKTGELDAICHLKAENAMRYALDLIATGMGAGEAWQAAIKAEIG